jgi:hypothetical protein
MSKPDYQLEAVKRVREEHHQKALARKRNLRSKDPLRVVGQQMYDALVQLQVVRGMGDKQFDKYNKAFTKRAIMAADAATRRANALGFYYARPLTKRQRSGE